MKLPQMSHPATTIEIHPSKKSVPFRPMLVKEEKLLLMAKHSEDTADILQAIKQVVNNCCIDPNFDVDAIPLFALQYAFIKLRAFSINDMVNVAYRDFDDDEIYKFAVDLKKLEVKYPSNAFTNKIEVTPSSGVTLKYPPASVYDDKEFLHAVDDEAFYRLIIKCLDQIYDGDTVYNASDFTEEDLSEFLELLDIKSYDKIREYMSALPSIYYKLTYTNSLGNEKVIELTSLTDFFTLL